MRERCVAEKRHTKDAMAVKEKQTERIKQLPDCVDELEYEVTSGKGIVADLNVKLKTSEKREEDFTCERDCL